MKIWVIIRRLLYAVLAVLIGFFGLSLLFSDLGPGETILERALTTLLLYVISGLLLGYFEPEVWGLSGITAWGAVVIGLSGLLAGNSSLLEGILILLLPLALALASGYAGSVLRRKRLFRRK